MIHLADAVTQCVLSGAIFTSLCAALIVPPCAWLCVRALGPSIWAMHDDRRWQATIAALAAVLPGALFLMLVLFGIAEGSKSPCLQTTSGKIMYGLLAAIIIAAIVRALLRAFARRRDLHAMLAHAKPAEGRAAAIAGQVGVALFEVDDNCEFLIFVASTPRSGVYISSFALQQFDDLELRAALFHERAHIDHADHYIAPWLYFLTDLLPLSVDLLIDIYRRAREFCADSGALTHVARTDLASALLRVARGIGASSPIAAPAFAEREEMYGRLAVLLERVPERPTNMRRRTVVTLALALIFSVGIALPTLGSLLFACQNSRMLS